MIHKIIVRGFSAHYGSPDRGVRIALAVGWTLWRDSHGGFEAVFALVPPGHKPPATRAKMAIVPEVPFVCDAGPWTAAGETESIDNRSTLTILTPLVHTRWTPEDAERITWYTHACGLPECRDGDGYAVSYDNGEQSPLGNAAVQNLVGELVYAC